MLNGLIVQQLGVVIAAVVGKDNLLRGQFFGDVHLLQGYNVVSHFTAHDCYGLVLQVSEVLIADGNATIVGITGTQGNTGRAEVGTDHTRSAVGGTLVTINQWQVVVNKYLHVGWMAVGQYLMVFVIAVVA